jgi:Zn ribbon nucleic-acid-binding protein
MTSTHDRAVCPACDAADPTVVPQTTPLGPPRMYCVECDWNSLDGAGGEGS